MKKKNKFTGKLKLFSCVVVFAFFVQMFVGVMPVMAASNPVLDGFTVTPLYSIASSWGWNYDVTGLTPGVTTHVTSSADITLVQYQYTTKTLYYPIIPEITSGWITGTFTPDVPGVLTAGTCASPALTLPADATLFTIGIKVTDALGGTVTQFAPQDYQVHNVTAASATVNNVVTNNAPLPTITGTVSDPLARLSVYVYNPDWSIYTQPDAVNNGDGTWTAQIVDALPEGTYEIEVDALNDNVLGTYGMVLGSYIVDTTAPIINPQADINVAATTVSGAVVTYTAPNAVDVVDGTFPATCSPPSGSLFPVGTTPITCSATDTAGNAAAPTTFNIIVSAPVPVTLTYVAGANGTISGTQSQSVLPGLDGSAVTAVADTGYHFVNWSDGVLTATRTDLSVTTDLTVTANYTINQNTATFVDWNGTVLGTSTVDYNTAATAPANPTRTGYTFAGWDVSFSNVTGPLTVTATYTINTINTINQNTATFVDWNGTVLGTSTVNYNTAATAPANPTRTGYTFAGWNTDFSNVTSDMTVTATYEINSYGYTVHYYQAGTTTSVSADTTGSANFGSVVTVPAAVVTGYTADAANKSVTIDVEGNVVIFYYTQDVVIPDNPTPTGGGTTIPDNQTPTSGNPATGDNGNTLPFIAAISSLFAMAGISISRIISKKRKRT